MDSKQRASVKVLSVCAAVDSAEGESRGGEPPPAEPDPDAEPAEPDTAGKVHGEQGAVPRGAETVHVRVDESFMLISFTT